MCLWPKGSWEVFFTHLTKSVIKCIKTKAALRLRVALLLFSNCADFGARIAGIFAAATVFTDGDKL